MLRLPSAAMVKTPALRPTPEAASGARRPTPAAPGGDALAGQIYPPPVVRGTEGAARPLVDQALAPRPAPLGRASEALAAK